MGAPSQITGSLPDNSSGNCSRNLIASGPLQECSCTARHSSPVMLTALMALELAAAQLVPDCRRLPRWRPGAQQGRQQAGPGFIGPQDGPAFGQSFFELAKAPLPPFPDDILVALAGAAHRLLQAEFAVLQNPSHLGRVAADAELHPDDPGHPHRVPAPAIRGARPVVPRSIWSALRGACGGARIGPIPAGPC